MSLEGDLQPGLEPAYVPIVRTTRLGVVGAVSSFFCVFPGTGLVGLIFGLLALREIATSNGKIAGASLAWAGIIGGLLSCLGWGVVARHYVQVSEEIAAPTAAFLQAWTRSEADGEAAAAPGLRPLMRTGGAGEAIRRELHDRLGAFTGLGPRTRFEYRPRLGGADAASATYQLFFETGAPVTATFDYARNDGRLQVLGVSFDSPVLAALTRHHLNALRGTLTPDLRDFGSPADHADPGVKSFAP